MGARSFVGQLMGAMKLYSYSSELLTFVEAKWYRARLATLGVLVGTIMFFGFMKLNQAVGITSGSRLAHRLAEENSALRQESILISPRLSELKSTGEGVERPGRKTPPASQPPRDFRGYGYRVYVREPMVEAPTPKFHGNKFPPVISTAGRVRSA